MNYAFFAIACYILMRGLQVLLEDHLKERWCKILIRVVTLIMLYAALASLIVWYVEFSFLGFSPSK